MQARLVQLLCIPENCDWVFYSEHAYKAIQSYQFLQTFQPLTNMFPQHLCVSCCTDLPSSALWLTVKMYPLDGQANGGGREDDVCVARSHDWKQQYLMDPGVGYLKELLQTSGTSRLTNIIREGTFKSSPALSSQAVAPNNTTTTLNTRVRHGISSMPLD